MSVKRLCLAGFFALALLGMAAGCVDNKIPDNYEKVPGADDDPAAMAEGTDLTAGDGSGLSDGKFSGGADESSVGKNPNEWDVIDKSGNRLGMPVIYFGFDTDVLAPSEQAKLDRIAEYVAKYPSMGLIIEGHCDARGTEEYNRALGQRRADAIRAYLVGKGLSDGRMKTLSFGKDRPEVEGSGESVWSRNRRGVPIPARMN